MCRDMGEVVAALHQTEPVQAQIKKPGDGRWAGSAMAQLANWILSTALDSQRARDTTMPHAADSPAVLQALILFTSTLSTWVRWEDSPVARQCPTLVLLSTVSDRCAVQTYGAKLLPDGPFLSRVLDTSPAFLAVECQLLKTELRDVTDDLLTWRRTAPSYVTAGFDRVMMAVIGACQELLYFDSFPVVPTISADLERLNGMMTDDHVHVHPTFPSVRVNISSTAGSDAAPVVPMSPSMITAASTRLRAEALRDRRDDP